MFAVPGRLHLGRRSAQQEPSQGKVDALFDGNRVDFRVLCPRLTLNLTKKIRPAFRLALSV
jgi:hypothetical protein